MDRWKDKFKKEKIRKRKKNGRTNMMDAQTGEGRRQGSGWCSKKINSFRDLWSAHW